MKRLEDRKIIRMYLRVDDLLTVLHDAGYLKDGEGLALLPEDARVVEVSVEQFDRLTVAVESEQFPDACRYKGYYCNQTVDLRRRE